MARVRSVVVASLAALLASCGGGGQLVEQEVVATTATPPPAGGGGGGGTGAALTVMTRNLYLGADIRRLAAATSAGDVPAAAGEMWEVIQATDFPGRAQAIADEVAAAAPHLLALQEVSLYRTGPTLCDGNSPEATEVAYDFLELLTAALAERQLGYAVAAVTTNFDQQICAQTGAERFEDVRLTDRDVILVRSDLAFANARTGSFQARAAFPVGGASLPVPRGWASVDVTTPLGDLRFAATHLEGEGAAAVQQEQAAELMVKAAEGLGTLPLVLAGDFNAGPELSQVTGTYDDLLQGGYRDPWPALNPTDPGRTCCFDEGLMSGALTSRIDLILYQGALTPSASARVGLLPMAILYPSDHAGVVTAFAAPGGGDPDCDCVCACPCPCEEDHDDDCDEHHHHGEHDCDHGGEHGDRDCDRGHHRDGEHGDRDCDRGHHRDGEHGDRDCDRDHHRDGEHGDRDCDRDHRGEGDEHKQGSADDERCPKDPKCCKERRDCGKDPKCCKERKDCGKDPKCCKERKDCCKDPKCCKERKDRRPGDASCAGNGK